MNFKINEFNTPQFPDKVKKMRSRQACVLENGLVYVRIGDYLFNLQEEFVCNMHSISDCNCRIFQLGSEITLILE